MKAVFASFLVYLTLYARRSFAEELDERVFNGLNAGRGQFPYQVFLRSPQPGGQTSSLCGGSLISNRHVLTAAHCLQGITSTQVTLGVFDLQNNQGTLTYSVPLSQTRIHPNYNPNTFNNDVGLVFLPQSIRFTSQIQPIRLPLRAWANPSTFDNYLVTVSGFGLTANSSPVPTRILQYRTVYMMPHRSCASVGLQPPITNGMVCTDRRINSGHCAGDSGGPLAVNVNNAAFLVGVVSWGGRPCVNNRPSVYANVAYYLPWISRMTGIPTN